MPPVNRNHTHVTPSSQGKKLKISDLNREGWLTELGKQAAPLFKAFHLHTYRITCGWPSSGGLTGKRLGECHARESSKSGVYEIFITPRLDDSLEVAGTVVHEMSHVAAGIRAGHGPGFVKVARYIGLTKGKPIHAMPGEELNEKLYKIIEGIGKYPHSAMDPIMRVKKKRKTSETLICVKCECKVRISLKWLAESGRPTCGCRGVMIPKSQVNRGEDEDE